MTYFYGHEVNVELYVDVVNKSVIFYIRMKTANDFNKHLEELRSDMSADNILQAAVLRKGLVMYHTQMTQIKAFQRLPKSGFSASWSICQHGCLTEVNTTFHRYNENNE